MTVPAKINFPAANPGGSALPDASRRFSRPRGRGAYPGGMVLLAAAVFSLCLLFSACGDSGGSGGSPPSGGFSNSSPGGSSSSGDLPSLDTVAGQPAVALSLLPEASGTVVESSEYGQIDLSNTADGYFMACYTGEPTQDFKDVKITVTGPSQTADAYPWRYNLRQDGAYETFPLSDGNGSYQIQLLKRTEGTLYAVLMSVDVSVELTDEFAPFLLPNQYINYSPDSLTVKLARELTDSSPALLGKVASVFDYVIGNISYDTAKAETVETGYLPDIDETLRTKRGICFDYAAVMTAMLRSIGVPTKLVTGYAGMGDGTFVYHAWLSVYSEEEGWIEKVVFFDGNDWQRMDPTFSSAGNNSQTAQFIGDGSNYQQEYLY